MATPMASLDRDQGLPKAAGRFRLSGGLGGGPGRKKSNKTRRGKGRSEDHSMLHCFISCPLVMIRGGVRAVGFHGLRRHGNKTPRSIVCSGEVAGELEWVTCRSSGGEPSLTPDPSQLAVLFFSFFFFSQGSSESAPTRPTVWRSFSAPWQCIFGLSSVLLGLAYWYSAAGACASTSSASCRAPG